MVKRKRFKKNQPFKWKHYSGEIILWLVRWYGRYALSYRDLKEIAAERGLEQDLRIDNKIQLCTYKKLVFSVRFFHNLHEVLS
ncbi:hypothetical protein Psal006b_02927 [Piscirickettsia salmonis]|uniref:Transposase n=1 Tax=Piscirickettsia salmonis TaxID=1238 RepID=A0AAC8ZN88_PISSA|nr:transposase [Piscirickettsia salmonis]QGN99902.1 hypothetical protein Psal006b_02927 [Piscirickettsia salmonis]QGO03552.1 hypothetical protein Psal008_02958 [Piscirickettsia salmonis]QGO14183.1 hypothetical protein Psal010b_02920 [Piscirickettsia salmonis]QGO21281.1 hypothetical protein Psal013_02964 [Piscirickettsia salmonis]